jgi:hypothetical protein
MSLEKKALRIDLNPNVKPIIKAVLAIRGFLMLAIGLGSLHTGIGFWNDSILVAIICFAVFVFFMIIGKKFLEQVFFNEYILLDDKTIKIYLKTFLQEKEHVFNIGEIKHFGFTGQHKYTQHPMHNSVIDITGLEATEKELQFVIDKGTLEIATELEKHRFGKNISSWDAEEIIEKIENYCQKKFNLNALNELNESK